MTTTSEKSNDVRSNAPASEQDISAAAGSDKHILREDKDGTAEGKASDSTDTSAQIQARQSASGYHGDNKVYLKRSLGSLFDVPHQLEKQHLRRLVSGLFSTGGEAQTPGKAIRFATETIPLMASTADFVVGEVEKVVGTLKFEKAPLTTSAQEILSATSRSDKTDDGERPAVNLPEEESLDLEAVRTIMPAISRQFNLPAPSEHFTTDNPPAMRHDIRPVLLASQIEITPFGIKPSKCPSDPVNDVDSAVRKTSLTANADTLQPRPTSALTRLSLEHHGLRRPTPQVTLRPDAVIYIPASCRFVEHSSNITINPLDSSRRGMGRLRAAASHFQPSFDFGKPIYTESRATGRDYFDANDLTGQTLARYGPIAWESPTSRTKSPATSSISSHKKFSIFSFVDPDTSTPDHSAFLSPGQVPRSLSPVKLKPTAAPFTPSFVADLSPLRQTADPTPTESKAKISTSAQLGGSEPQKPRRRASAHISVPARASSEESVSGTAAVGTCHGPLIPILHHLGLNWDAGQATTHQPTNVAVGESFTTDDEKESIDGLASFTGRISGRLSGANTMEEQTVHSSPIQYPIPFSQSDQRLQNASLESITGNETFVPADGSPLQTVRRDALSDLQSQEVLAGGSSFQQEPVLSSAGDKISRGLAVLTEDKLCIRRSRESLYPLQTVKPTVSRRHTIPRELASGFEHSTVQAGVASIQLEHQELDSVGAPCSTGRFPTYSDPGHAQRNTGGSRLGRRRGVSKDFPLRQEQSLLKVIYGSSAIPPRKYGMRLSSALSDTLVENLDSTRDSTGDLMIERVCSRIRGQDVRAVDRTKQSEFYSRRWI